MLRLKDPQNLVLANYLTVQTPRFLGVTFKALINQYD